MQLFILIVKKLKVFGVNLVRTRWCYTIRVTAALSGIMSSD